MSTNEFEERKKTTVPVFGIELSSYLLKKGYRCVDIMADRKDETHKKSVLFFAVEGDIKKDIYDYISGQIEEKDDETRHTEDSEPLRSVVSVDDIGQSES